MKILPLLALLAVPQGEPQSMAVPPVGPLERRISTSRVEQLLGSTYTVNGYTTELEKSYWPPEYVLRQFKRTNEQGPLEAFVEYSFTADAWVSVTGAKAQWGHIISEVKCPSRHCARDLAGTYDRIIDGVLRAMDAQRALEDGRPEEKAYLRDRYREAERRVLPAQRKFYETLVRGRVLPESMLPSRP